jgi:maltooligosyltrehalose trehalohydrolase
MDEATRLLAEKVERDFSRLFDARVAPVPESMNFGATLVSARETRFRFWAPALQRVLLEVEGLDPIRMRRLKDGWFESYAPCGVGAAYKFRISDNLCVADPAARAMRGDATGHSLVTDPGAYRWRNDAWRGLPWTDTVFYELHVGAYGGFAGVTQALPELAELGITAVELMPIASFPGRLNWGYDGVLPYAPSPSYGTPEDLKELIDTAHGLGMMVFLDVVYNHFGPEGNFLDVYAPPFFRNDVENAWGRAIDFRHPQVRRFYTENALYWLEEFRFDGLRFDAVHAITHPDWLDETAAELRGRLEKHRAVYLVLENDDNVASHMRDGFFEAQWNDDCHHALHVLLTGETDSYYAAYADAPAHLLARCLCDGFAYQGEPSCNRSGEPRGTPSGDLPPSAFVAFLQNHDQIGNRAWGERLTTLTRQEALEAAIALQLLCPQIPLIFMGEETASRSPFLFFAEHNEEIAGSIRDGRKREFKYEAMDHELPDPNATETFERSVPQPDDIGRQARRSLYRQLLALRRAFIAPRIQGASAIEACALSRAAIMARWRLGDGSTLTIACNLAKPVRCLVPEGIRLFASTEKAYQELNEGLLSGFTTVALLNQMAR